MEIVLSGIRKTDFVSMTVNPSLNGSYRVKSVIGGLLSIIVASCVGFGFLYFSLRILRRDNPIMNYTQMKSNDATISLIDTPFMLGIYDKYGKRVNNDEEVRRSLKMTAQLGKIIPNKENGYTVEYFEGPLKNCSKEDMSDQTWQDLIDASFATARLMCPDPPNMLNNKGEGLESSIVLRNEYPNKDIEFLRFKVKLCDENEDPGCSAYFLSEGYLNVIINTANYFADQTNFTNPVKSDFQGISTYISPNFNQVRFIFSKVNELVTDSSLFLADTSSLIYNSVSRTETGMTGFDIKDKTILQVICSVDQLISKNERKYLKIPEMMAVMGGFIKGVLIITQLMVKTYSEYNLFVQIESLKVSCKSAPVGDASVISQFRSIDTSKSNALRNKRKLPQVKKFSFLQYLSYTFCCWKKHKVIINKTTQFKYLDLNFLIKILTFSEQEMNKQENPIK